MFINQFAISIFGTMLSMATIATNNDTFTLFAVKGNVCDGCHMILPAQFANEVHGGDKIVFCPYCSRILFYEELKEGETEYSHIEDIGSLSDYGDEEDFLDDEYFDDEYDRDDSVKAIDFE